MGIGDGGQVPFGPQLDTIPETYTALEFSERPSPKGGGVPVPPVTSVQPEAPDNLLEALRGASIVDEHRVLMDTVIEKVQSVKSGLTEACTSLLTGYYLHCDIFPIITLLTSKPVRRVVHASVSPLLGKGL